MDQPSSDDTNGYLVDTRNRVRRRPQRGKYDRDTVFAILDAGLICHLAYVVDGQPYCTPTSYWREGEVLYWHGSAASRMIRSQVGQKLPMCLTVTHLDALTLARSGFNHAVNYRSVMAYGTAELITDDEKEGVLDRFIDRIYPGRSATLRTATRSEIQQTAIAAMPIEQASAKVRDVMFGDDEEDYAIPTWTAVIRTKLVVDEIIECPRLPGDVAKPKELAGYAPGAVLDDLLAATHRTVFARE